ncbi:MAG TPA: methyltransferase domain-containing protein [Rudaea sp.]|nr:methyltransferase domain-containing protein [Rudaea sp.]
MQHTYDSSFMNYADLSSRQSARAISEILREVLKIDSVLDIGCARGTWLGAWQESGVADIFGADGEYVSTRELVIPANRFVAADLSRPIDLGRKFDLVQSLEVAEHIPTDCADQFVENLTRHSGGFVLFSAAPPGQGGEFHINEQPYDYWRARFQRHDFIAHDWIRPRIARDPSISFWYRFNTILYVHRDLAQTLPVKLRAARVPDATPIADISPLWFRARKLLIRGLPFAVQQKLARLKARSWRRAQTH